MKAKQIIIPNCEYMSDKEFAKVIEIIDSLPIDYQILEQEN